MKKLSVFKWQKSFKERWENVLRELDLFPTGRRIPAQE